MADVEIKNILTAVPQLLSIPFKHIWYSYDEGADVLYMNFMNVKNQDTTLYAARMSSESP
jgi:hypothetical protein